MDVLSSAEFRKHYAKLDGPTLVTANGIPIGTWTPTVRMPPDTVVLSEATAERIRSVRVMDSDSGFNTRPFTPVPKRG